MWKVLLLISSHLTVSLRVFTAVMLGYTTLVSAFTSSIFSTATRTVAAQYHVSTEVGLLGLSLYVLGFALGPTFWAPLSELRGRRLPIVISMFGFSIFQIGVAAAKDLQTIFLCRFWGGGSYPLAPEFRADLHRYFWCMSTGCGRRYFLRHVR